MARTEQRSGERTDTDVRADPQRSRKTSRCGRTVGAPENSSAMPEGWTSAKMTWAAFCLRAFLTTSLA
jgi:hypothetical protein